MDSHAAEGLDGLKMSVRETRERLADFRITVLDQVAEGDKVATRWRATMKSSAAACPGTDADQLAMDGITIERFADGKVVESWRSMDRLGLMQQLGVLPRAAVEEPGGG